MQELNPRGGYATEWVPVKRKDGSDGLRLKQEFVRYSPLLTCECCGFVHGKRRVQTCFTWQDPAGEKGEMGYAGKVYKVLCLRCRFTLEAARRKWLAYDQLRIEANRIRKKINESTKDNARVA